MGSGDDPDDFLYTIDGYRERLEDMGQPVPVERYEDSSLQALPTKYERVVLPAMRGEIFTSQAFDA